MTVFLGASNVVRLSSGPSGSFGTSLRRLLETLVSSQRAVAFRSAGLLFQPLSNPHLDDRLPRDAEATRFAIE